MPSGKVIFLADGMADEPLPELNGRTPLQYAATPGMDAIAAGGKSGTLLTLPPGYPTSSDVANMSVLGCDLETEYCGRGVLEAYARGIELHPDDVALRCNLVTCDKEGRLVDFAGGHPSREEAEGLVEELNRGLANDRVRFYPGLSYRCLLILRGGFDPEVVCDKPDDHGGELTCRHLPRAGSAGAKETAELLTGLIKRAGPILSRAAAGRDNGKRPVNAIWPWSPGRSGVMQPFQSRTGAKGAVISAVDVIKGLGRLLGMRVIEVPGATGYIDTNYEGKARAAINALLKHDLVYLHVEAIDEVSHARDLDLKIRTIETFDRRIVQPVMHELGPDVSYVILPDHPVPIRLGKHTRDPVPVAWSGPGVVADGVTAYDEISALRGSLGRLRGDELMRLLFPRPGRT